MLQLLNSIIESGLYKQLVQSGLISFKLQNYRDIYLYVSAKMQINGMGKEQAVNAAADQFDVSRATVYRAIKILEQSQFSETKNISI